MTEAPQHNLPPRCFEVCKRRIHGWPQEDIAEDLRISQATVSRDIATAIELHPDLEDKLWRDRRGRPRKSA